ncbi:MAG: DUF309 domain-containing protein [Gammaproteobacteria bacterium]
MPGRAPHPTRDPQGHSYGARGENVGTFEPGSWARNECFLFAVDLLNHGYWWEAHEALEALWVAAGRHTPEGYFLQGLIQLGVAMLKRHQHMQGAARRLASDGLAKIAAVPNGFMGIDQADVRAQVARCLADDAVPALQVRLAGAATHER